MIDLFPDLYQQLLAKIEVEHAKVAEVTGIINAVKDVLHDTQVYFTNLHSDVNVKRVIKAKQAIDECLYEFDTTKLPVYCKQCGAHIVDLTLMRFQTVNSFDAERIDMELCNWCLHKLRNQEHAKKCEAYIETMMRDCVYTGCVVDPNYEKDGITQLFFDKIDPETNEVNKIAVIIRPQSESDDVIDFHYLKGHVRNVTADGEYNTEEFDDCDDDCDTCGKCGN